MSYRDRNPDTLPIGRQPAQIQIAPSKTYPWYGRIRDGRVEGLGVVGGDRFTENQVMALERLGIALEGVRSLLVKRQATNLELWWPSGELPPVFAFECPVLRDEGEKVRVIALNGDAKLVFADGWTRRPATRVSWGL